MVPDDDILSLMRVASLDMVENAGILENMIGNYYPDSDSRVAPISIENETKVMRNIGRMCAKAI